MAKIRALLSGIVLGFVLAHLVNKNPTGRRFFERVNQAVDELVDAAVNGYKEAEETRD
ncbi:Na+ dependent nucleoside transporter N-terminal domain-containing protein [Canibacter zhoujuaniae]|uniref:Na+ dependent nucleoside transporter N-terminal domain-containing protein n=1 Tax=Canibacter zhoujuaniae TaxID=2708343 RepID=UPI00141F96FA|nr:Na+ dependent nucleoside transporter N-terminal domain-containing protein [Canibacter zhoujuaniae]